MLYRVEPLVGCGPLPLRCAFLDCLCERCRTTWRPIKPAVPPPPPPALAGGNAGKSSAKGGPRPPTPRAAVDAAVRPLVWAGAVVSVAGLPPPPAGARRAPDPDTAVPVAATSNAIGATASTLSSGCVIICSGSGISKDGGRTLCGQSTPLALPCVVVARQVTQTLHSAARGRRTRHTGSDLFESVLPGPHSDIQKCQVSVDRDMAVVAGIRSSPSHCTWHRSGTCPPRCVCTSCTADGPLSSVQTALSSHVWCQGVSCRMGLLCVCCTPYQRCCRTVCCCRTGMAGVLHLHGTREASALYKGGQQAYHTFTVRILVVL